MVPLLETILGFLWVVYFFETYLSYRQHRKLKETKVPKELASIVTEEKFIKSQQYGLDKSNYNFLSSAFSQIEGTLVLWFGGLPFLWKYSVRLLNQLGFSEDYEIGVSLVFLLLGMLYETVIHIPWELYFIFVIEERHGFNKQTLGLYIKDKVKGLILSIVFGAPAVSALLWIIQRGGEHFYFYAWLFLLAFSLFMLTIYPNVIAPLFNKFTPLEEGELKTEIEKLAASISFPLTKIFVVDGSKRSGHSNAYFFGFFKNKRIVLFDTLLKQMDLQEIVSVLGHELGHWSRNHTIKLLIIGEIQLFVYFWLFGKLIHWELMYTSFGFDTQPIIIGLIVFFQFLLSPVAHVLDFLMNVLSREFEFEADRFAKTLGYGENLKSGLIKINIENLGNLNPDPWYSTYHYSHPPLLERLNALGVKKD